MDGPAWRSVAILMVTMVALWLLVDRWYDEAAAPEAAAHIGQRRP